MKSETVAETTISQTSASFFQILPKPNRQSEQFQSRRFTSDLKTATQDAHIMVVASFNIQEAGLENAIPIGFQPFPIRGGLVTNELIDKLREDIGD
ncbi:MAG: hypothetical protein OXG56_08930 [Gammaproteobacteria bacterium]|nr:hypothetical protein [Gammaproteobacteria bacterium]